MPCMDMPCTSLVPCPWVMLAAAVRHCSGRACAPAAVSEWPAIEGDAPCCGCWADAGATIAKKASAAAAETMDCFITSLLVGVVGPATARRGPGWGSVVHEPGLDGVTVGQGRGHNHAGPFAKRLGKRADEPVGLGRLKRNGGGLAP